jgi:hypothetical protein
MLASTSLVIEKSGWPLVFIILGADVLWGLLNFGLMYRRSRRGRGMSAMVSPTFVAYALPCFLSRESLVFGIAGFGPLRLAESLVLAVCLGAMSIFITMVLPGVLVSKLVPTSGEDEGR